MQLTPLLGLALQSLQPDLLHGQLGGHQDVGTTMTDISVAPGPPHEAEHAL